jgi:hypothetical protein
MTLLTPEQHRILAANLLKTAGTPGHQSKARAKQMAQHHENMALMIEHRGSGTGPENTDETGLGLIFLRKTL